MRIANVGGRAALLGTERALDISTASGGRFGPHPQEVFDEWTGFCQWAGGIDVDNNSESRGYEASDLGAPSPTPSQVFAIGLNYADHAAEASMTLPENPLVFTKFASSITGPFTELTLSGDRVDWEAELVVVIGSGGRNIARADGWDAVAGLTVGQDISDRTVQSWGAPSAQFALGKSFPGYGPTGPALVTLDEIRDGHDPDALRIECRVSDGAAESRILQSGNTRDLIFSVPVLIERLSAIVHLRSGDLIFTGTPAGVGIGREPAVFLEAGQRLTTTIEAVGTIEQVLRHGA
jgi:2-keto-4-pentenoate hydratase/2-oxohepta-3-ene-1,7-dioic acid hydratase in catechol pathway